MQDAFEFTLIDDDLRKKIVKHVKPTKGNFFSYQNLNLAYGVRDSNGMFLTCVYYMSQAIMRDGRDVNDYRYIVIDGINTFTVDYQEKLFGDEFGNLALPFLHKRYANRVKAAILLYEDWQERKKFEDTLSSQDADISLYHLKKTALDALEQSL